MLPARFVIALDKAKAEETPFPPPDMSSPRSNLANLSFIISTSARKTQNKCTHQKREIKSTL